MDSNVPWWGRIKDLGKGLRKRMNKTSIGILVINLEMFYSINFMVIKSNASFCKVWKQNWGPAKLSREKIPFCNCLDGK